MTVSKNPEYVPYTTEKNAVLKGVLYLVATPIGNLADISQRALKVLSEVDFVAAEDTRNSGRLLSYFGIKKPLVSYFEHNKAERGEEIAARLSNGESCALVTDAGMPAISDPGEDIVAVCAVRGIPVTVIPGASASVSALAVSGLPTGKFVFEGFLPSKKSDRRSALGKLSGEERTIIFYEAPHRLRETLADMLSALGDRRIALCRELTKINEEVIRTTFSGAVEMYKSLEPRGEYVIVTEGAKHLSGKAFWDDMSELQHVEYYTERGMTKNEAIKAAAHDRGVQKNDIYGKVMKKP